MARLDIDAVLVTDLLTRFLRAEAGKFGFTRAVLGLSGGVDSAVTCALAAQAFGPRNVLAVLMPHEASNPDSESRAREVAAGTGVRTKLVDLAPLVDGYLDAEAVVDEQRRADLLARARMTVLYDQSAAQNGLVIGTSNKTKLLLGSTTQFGDVACALAPLGDLYKQQVDQLARHLMLPASPDQAPPAELGCTYALIDEVLVRLVDERATAAELEAAGFEGGLVHRLVGRIAQSQHERLPPTVAKLGERTLGQDFRYLRSWGH